MRVRKGEKTRGQDRRRSDVSLLLSLSHSNSPSLFVRAAHVCILDPRVMARACASAHTSNAGRSYPSRGSSRVKPLSNVARARSTAGAIKPTDS